MTSRTGEKGQEEVDCLRLQHAHAAHHHASHGAPRSRHMPSCIAWLFHGRSRCTLRTPIQVKR